MVFDTKELPEDPEIPKLLKKKKPPKAKETWRTKNLPKTRKSKRKTTERDLLTSDKMGTFKANLISNIPVMKPKEKTEDLGVTIDDPTNYKLDTEKYKFLVYHQKMRALDPEMDDESHLWHIRRVLKHKIKNGKLSCKVLWSDMTTTWENVYALFHHVPQALYDYSKDNKLSNKKAWNHLEKCYEASLNFDSMAKAFKTSQIKGPKFKFGVEVPRSVNHALQLDKKNGNTLWEDAIKTELKMLEKYNTFRLRTEGESLEEYLKFPTISC